MASFQSLSFAPSSTSATMTESSPSNTAAAAAAASASASSSRTVAAPAPATVKTPSTDAFLKDFTLVAEAAKRAQVAVMMRDFANVGL